MSRRIPDKIKVIHFRYHRTAKSRHKTPQYVCQCKTNNKEYNKNGKSLVVTQDLRLVLNPAEGPAALMF